VCASSSVGGTGKNTNSDRVGVNPVIKEAEEIVQTTISLFNFKDSGKSIDPVGFYKRAYVQITQNEPFF